MSDAPAPGGPRILLMYLATAATWGASFLFIAVALEGLSPVQLVFGRLATGALTLLLLSAAFRRALPQGRRVWGHLVVPAVVLCVVPFLLFAWAEQHVSSGVASILNATTPLMTTLVTLVALRAERLTRVQVAGLLLGFVGVVVVLGPGRVGGADLGGELACLGATACYGMGFVYLRKYVSPMRLPALTVATGQVGLAALAMVPLLPFLGTGEMHLTGRVVVSVLLLGAVGTGFAYVWNTAVVAAWGAAAASSVTYLTPLVGVLLGVLLLDERPAWRQPLGAVLIVLGIAVSQDRFAFLRRRRTRVRPT